MQPDDAADKETIGQSVPCLITGTEEAITTEHWLNTTTTGYRAQKATITIRFKIAKVEAFSNYLVSPLRKNYRVFFGSMVTSKVIQCWLRLNLSKKAPKNW